MASSRLRNLLTLPRFKKISMRKKRRKAEMALLILLTGMVEWMALISS